MRLVLRSREQLWVLLAIGTPIALTPVALVFHWTLRHVYGMSPGPAWAAGIGIVGTFVLGFGLTARMLFAPVYPTRAERAVAAVVWAVMLAVTATALASGFLNLPPAAAGAVGLVVLPIAAHRYRRTVDRGTPLVTRNPVSVADLRDAAAMVDACRAQLRDPRTTDAERTVVEINLASGLAQSATLAGTREGTDEAAAILTRVLQAPGVNPATVVLATEKLVAGKHIQAARHGDGDGYAEAIRLQRDVVGRLRPDDPRTVVAQAQALGDRAAYHDYRMALLAGQGHPLWRRERDLLVAALQAGLRLVRPRSRLAVEMTVLLGLTVALAGEPPDVDGGIELLTAAESRARRRARPAVRLPLARLLLIRAEAAGPRAAADLRAAVRAAESVVRSGRPELRGSGYLVLARAAAFSARSGVPVGRGLGSPAGYYRRAVAEQARLSTVDVSRVALEWASWAVSAGDAAEAADAYWRLVGLIPAEVSRRLYWSGRAEAVAVNQGIAAAAGYWLARAGRLQDAVVAIESARGILLRQRLGRVPPDLAARLTGAGRPDLYAVYVEAVNRLDAVQRRQYLGDPAATTDGVLVGEVRYWTGGVSPAHAAWSELHRRSDEIAAVLGGADPVVAPDWELLRAAAADGPLVYLAAADQAGYALVVRTDAPEPIPVWLPGLSSAALTDMVARYRDFARQPPPYSPELRDVLEWSWTEVMSRLLPQLRGAGVVTVVAVGATGLLPLHAATDPAADPPRYANDHLLLRYAPNAASVVAARQASRTAPPGPVLAIDVADPPGAPPIPNAAVESRGVQRRYRPDCVRLPRARRDQTSAHLGTGSVWHFACHGSADPVEPLDSRLMLADRSLSLRDILAMPSGQRRLAVLSACETNVPDNRRLDEVISFPGALLQAGLGSVVASAWKVDDTAAMCLVLRFHDLLRCGRRPAAALTEAQRWLRTSTNADIAATLPEYGPSPAERSEAWAGRRTFEDPEFWAAFSLTGE